MWTNHAKRPTRRPRTALVAAGRTHPADQPLVLASSSRTAPGRTSSTTVGREDARDGGTPTCAAPEAVLARLEGGAAAARSSGTADAASLLDLLPAGEHVPARPLGVGCRQVEDLRDDLAAALPSTAPDDARSDR